MTVTKSELTNSQQRPKNVRRSTAVYKKNDFTNFLPIHDLTTTDFITTSSQQQQGNDNSGSIKKSLSSFIDKGNEHNYATTTDAAALVTNSSLSCPVSSSSQWINQRAIQRFAGALRAAIARHHDQAYEETLQQCLQDYLAQGGEIGFDDDDDDDAGNAFEQQAEVEEGEGPKKNVKFSSMTLVELLAYRDATSGVVLQEGRTLENRNDAAKHTNSSPPHSADSIVETHYPLATLPSQSQLTLQHQFLTVWAAKLSELEARKAHALNETNHNERAEEESKRSELANSAEALNSDNNNNNSETTKHVYFRFQDENDLTTFLLSHVQNQQEQMQQRSQMLSGGVPLSHESTVSSETTATSADKKNAKQSNGGWYDWVQAYAMECVQRDLETATAKADSSSTKPLTVSQKRNGDGVVVANNNNPSITNAFFAVLQNCAKSSRNPAEPRHANANEETASETPANKKEQSTVLQDAIRIAREKATHKWTAALTELQLQQQEEQKKQDERKGRRTRESSNQQQQQKQLSTAITDQGAQHDGQRYTMDLVSTSQFVWDTIPLSEDEENDSATQEESSSRMDKNDPLKDYLWPYDLERSATAWIVGTSRHGAARERGSSNNNRRGGQRAIQRRRSRRHILLNYSPSSNVDDVNVMLGTRKRGRGHDEGEAPSYSQSEGDETKHYQDSETDGEVRQQEEEEEGYLLLAHTTGTAATARGGGEDASLNLHPYSRSSSRVRVPLASGLVWAGLGNKGELYAATLRFEQDQD